MRTNFCTHAIDGFVKSNRHARLGDESIVNQMLHDSVKFRIPAYGGMSLDGAVQKNFREEFPKNWRLPFPCIALEFSGDLAFRNQQNVVGTVDVILLARELSDDEDTKILVWRLARHSVDSPGVRAHTWSTSRCGAVLSRSTLDVGFMWETKADESFVKSEVNDWQAHMLAVYAQPILSLVEFRLALSCSNVSIAVTPSVVTGRIRRSGIKAPFFEYRELMVGQDRTVGGGHACAGGRDGPRQHLRRGHIRHLVDRNIWINSMVVGDPGRGVLQKDYRLADRSRRSVAA